MENKIQKIETNLTKEMKAMRQDLTEEMKTMRQDLTQEMKTIGKNMTEEMKTMGENLTEEMKTMRQDLTKEMKTMGKNMTEEMKAMRQDLSKEVKKVGVNLSKEMRSVSNEFKSFAKQSQKHNELQIEILQSLPQQLASLISNSRRSETQSGSSKPFAYSTRARKSESSPYFSQNVATSQRNPLDSSEQSKEAHHSDKAVYYQRGNTPSKSQNKVQHLSMTDKSYGTLQEVISSDSKEELKSVHTPIRKNVHSQKRSSNSDHSSYMITSYQLQNLEIEKRSKMMSQMMPQKRSQARGTESIITQNPHLTIIGNPHI